MEKPEVITYEIGNDMPEYMWELIFY